MARKVNVMLPDSVSDADFKSALTKGVPPELTALLDSVRGLLGVLDQSVRTMSESNRLSAESHARAIKDAAPNLDVSAVSEQLAHLSMTITASNKAVEKSMNKVATVIADTVKAYPAREDNTQAIVDALAPFLNQAEGPRRFHIDLNKNEDGLTTSVDGFTEDVRH